MWNLARKDPTWLNTRYEILRTWNSKHQGLWIITMKNMIKKSYFNDEYYLIAIELILRGTFIIRVFIEENTKNHILDQLVRLWKKNKM